MLLVACSLPACVGQSTSTTEARDCTAVAEHAIAMRVASASSDAERAQLEEGLRATMASAFVPRCEAELSDEQRRCALASVDEASLRACTEAL
ncbi:MAG: hypothetical protein R2939_00360 [Kofleriaceae bacterium]